MDRDTYITCCGVSEAQGFSRGVSAKNNLLDLYETCLDWDYDDDGQAVHGLVREGRAHIIYSYIKEQKEEGEAFTKFIKKNKLGTVVTSRGARNPNTGNWLWTCIFTPSWKTYTAWYKENKK